MQSKGLYKAMGELDLLFNYIETYLASKRRRTHVASAWIPDRPDLWPCSSCTLLYLTPLLCVVGWGFCFVSFLSRCLCCSETSVDCFVLRTSFQTILRPTHMKLQHILPLETLWYLFFLLLTYDIYLFWLDMYLLQANKWIVEHERLFWVHFMGRYSTEYMTSCRDAVYMWGITWV